MTTPGLPDPVWTVLGWPSALALCSHGVVAWLRGGRRFRLALLLVWVGIGLSAFLFYAHAWRYPWSGAAWAICFLAVALALLRQTEKQELRSLGAATGDASVPPLLCAARLGCWVLSLPLGSADDAPS